MSAFVIDSNVLTVASALEEGWTPPRIPLKDLSAIATVIEWVTEFRDDDSANLVMDCEQTIMTEYKSRSNMPNGREYGRRVVQEKLSKGQVEWAELEYWENGNELVARLPPGVEALTHDLGDRKMLAAASATGALLVNATDSDWTEPNVVQALTLLGVQVHQLLTDAQRAACRETDRG